MTVVSGADSSQHRLPRDNTDSTMATGNVQKPSLHDWLTLGEVDRALSHSESSPVSHREEEIHRLPLLLRLLSASQPLSSTPSFDTHDSKHTSSTEEDDDGTDPLVNRVVSRLEDVAATYSAAEGIDELTCLHAPCISRKISRLAPLKQRKAAWSVEDLAAVASSPIGEPHRKRSKTDTQQQSLTLRHLDSADEIQAGDDELDEDGDALMKGDQEDYGLGDTLEAPKSSSRTGKQNSLQTARSAENSLEVRVVKTLSEISSLVVDSLKPLSLASDDEEGTPVQLGLSVKTDSLLALPASTARDTERLGNMGGADLGSTLAALMHHAPVLRHRHVANALCRAAVPQTAELIAQLGANCPTAVPCLLRGCIDAFLRCDVSDGSIANAARAAVRSLARLSHGESYRVRTTLQQSNVMLGVQLELAAEQDPVITACLLNQHLATEILEGGLGQATKQNSRQNGISQDQSNIETNQTRKPGSLLNGLQTNSELASKTYTCIADGLEHLFAGETAAPIPWGRACLLLRALGWLLLSVDAEPWAFQVQACIQELLRHFQDGCENPRSCKDECFKLVLCCCLSVYTHLSSGAETLDKGAELVREALLKAPISVKSGVYQSRLAGLLLAQEPLRLFVLMVETLSGSKSSTPSSIEQNLNERYLALCEWASNDVNFASVASRGEAPEAVAADPSAMLQSIELGTVRGSQVAATWNTILQDPEKCESMIASEAVCDLVTKAIPALLNESKAKLPQVLPIQLHALALKIDWRGNPKTSLHHQFLLQLLYCMKFLREEPDSPFVIDPRDLPLAEILQFCSSLDDSSSAGLARVKSLVKCLILTYAPEAKQSFWGNRLSKDHGFEARFLSRHQATTNLISLIRRSVDDRKVDPSGEHAEAAVIQAHSELSSSEVDITCARALLSNPYSPLPCITYTALCRDPLVLLKCHVSAWKSPGLRRITLDILWRLLKTNRSIILGAAPLEETAQELLASRNAIIVRCLLLVICGESSHARIANNGSLTSFCQSTTGIIRSLILEQGGLVATLARQGVPDSAIDWLTEFVPESIKDAQALNTLLSSRSSLTAAERLTIADASLRIAVVQGTWHEDDAVTLVYSALNTLISCFHLVIGPVGVPVSAVCEEDGRDATQICRSATFRMLKALQTVRAERSAMRAECGRALQKLAGLCKGESMIGSMPGGVVSTRKKLVKEIWDAVAKASTAIGPI